MHSVLVYGKMDALNYTSPNKCIESFAALIVVFPLKSRHRFSNERGVDDGQDKERRKDVGVLERV